MFIPSEIFASKIIYPAKQMHYSSNAEHDDDIDKRWQKKNSQWRQKERRYSFQYRECC